MGYTILKNLEFRFNDIEKRFKRYDTQLNSPFIREEYKANIRKAWQQVRREQQEDHSES